MVTDLRPRPPVDDEEKDEEEGENESKTLSLLR